MYAIRSYYGAYAIVLGTVVYRELGVKELLDVFKHTIEFTAIILFIISVAGLYGWLMVRLQIPMNLAEGVVHLTTNPTLLLIILMVFFLIIGVITSYSIHYTKLYEIGLGIVLATRK